MARRTAKYPWETIKPGESFTMDCKIASARCYAYARGKDLGKKFSITLGSQGKPVVTCRSEGCVWETAQPGSFFTLDWPYLKAAAVAEHESRVQSGKWFRVTQTVYGTLYVLCFAENPPEEVYNVL